MSHHETLRRKHEYHPKQTAKTSPLYDIEQTGGFGGFRDNNPNYGESAWRYSNNLDPHEEGGHYHISRFTSHKQYNENRPMTVFASPTRGYPVDGKAGRASEHVIIPQPSKYNITKKITCQFLMC